MARDLLLHEPSIALSFLIVEAESVTYIFFLFLFGFFLLLRFFAMIIDVYVHYISFVYVHSVFGVTPCNAYMLKNPKIIMADGDQVPDVEVHEERPMPAISDELWNMILDRSTMAANIINLLKGYVHSYEYKDGEVTVGWVKSGERLMNDHGIRLFSTIIHAAITPDKLITHITEDEARERSREMDMEIILIIAKRGKEFFIKRDNWGVIRKIMDDYYFFAMTGSRRGTLIELIKPTYERKETITPRRDKPGMFGFLRRGG